MSVFIQHEKTCCGRAVAFAIRMQFFVATLALITLAAAVRGEQGESDGQAQRDYVSIPNQFEKKKSDEIFTGFYYELLFTLFYFKGVQTPKSKSKILDSIN